MKRTILTTTTTTITIIKTIKLELKQVNEKLSEKEISDRLNNKSCLG
jgi:hypothetical protein